MASKSACENSEVASYSAFQPVQHQEHVQRDQLEAAVERVRHVETEKEFRLASALNDRGIGRKGLGAMRITAEKRGQSHGKGQLQVTGTSGAGERVAARED